MTISELKRQDKRFLNRYKNLRIKFKRRRLKKYGCLICCKCGYTTRELNGEITTDHRDPLEKGGRNDKSNLQLLCIRCHLKKNKQEAKK